MNENEQLAPKRRRSGGHTGGMFGGRISSGGVLGLSGTKVDMDHTD